jgi:TonB family protein
MAKAPNRRNNRDSRPRDVKEGSVPLLVRARGIERTGLSTRSRAETVLRPDLIKDGAVSDTANTITPGTEKGNNAAVPRPNPVALEVLVSVTGARANGSASRELFTEDTKTVLVFPDGAVIRLAAEVSPGQLLFLTNKRSAAEVVCKVMHLRPYQPGVSYADLQFTEEKKRFWDMNFSTGTRSTAEFSIREHIEAEAATHNDPSVVVQAHKEEDVEQLKSEVEALRKQLIELEKKNAAEKAAAEAAAAEKAEADAKAAEAAIPTPRRHQEELVPAHEQVPQAPQAPLMPATEVQKQAPARPVVGMSLPTRSASDGTKAFADISEELLPKPGLDFSHVPSNAPVASRLGLVRRRGIRFDWRELLVLSLGGVLLVGLIVGAVVWKPWKGLGQKKSNAEASTETAAEPTTSVPNSVTRDASSEARASNVTPKSEESKPAKHTAVNTEPAIAKKATAAHDPDAGTNASKVSKGHAKTAVVQNTEKDSAATTDASANDAPVLPAKLLKSVSPVYPPDALLNFIAGDVRAEAEVGADGRVGEVKILSGPQQFREAALQALKQYQYAPATQGSKPVPSHVRVTVKFWFDP